MRKTPAINVHKGLCHRQQRHPGMVTPKCPAASLVSSETEQVTQELPGAHCILLTNRCQVILLCLEDTVSAASDSQIFLSPPSMTSPERQERVSDRDVPFLSWHSTNLFRCSDWLGVIILTLSTILASLSRAESSVNLHNHFSLQLSKNPLCEWATIRQLRDIQAVCKS